MLKEKSPEEKIKDIEYAFFKGYPIYGKRRKEKKIWYYVFSALAALVLSGLISFFMLSRKPKQKKVEKIPEISEKTVCILYAPYDDEAIRIALDHGVRDIKIVSEKKQKKNNIKPFVGDFKSFDDSIVVSSRLNTKSIPNRIEKMKDIWRVYIDADVPEIKGYFDKELSPINISSIEKLLSQRFNEVVKIEVSVQEIPVAKVIMEFSDVGMCEKILNAFKLKGKIIEGGVKIKD